MIHITVIGAGYVGLVAAACFAHVGHKVYCVDTDKAKITNLQKGKLPIFEPCLDVLINEGLRTQNLHFTTQFNKTLAPNSIIIITVGTPMQKDGTANTHFITSLAEEIGQKLQYPVYILIKSTLPVSTTLYVKNIIETQLRKRNKNISFQIAYNPEFLQASTAVNNFLNPYRVVIGLETTKNLSTLKRLYAYWIKKGTSLLFMDITSAEMAKYVANALLATKISFINDIANLCERLGGNIQQIYKGISGDPRIGKHFLEAGVGYGGSCLPKDIEAFIQIGKKYNYPLKILQAAQSINRAQRTIIYANMKKHFQNIPLEGKKVAIWGLTFKPNTNDVRESPTLYLLEQLLKEKVCIVLYDPLPFSLIYIQKNYKKRISFANSLKDSLIDSEALVVMTAWEGFKKVPVQTIITLMKTPIIFDGRNALPRKKLLGAGCTYYGIGI